MRQLLPSASASCREVSETRVPLSNFTNVYVMFTGCDKRQDRDLKQVGPGSYQISLIDRKKEPAFS